MAKRGSGAGRHSQDGASKKSAPPSLKAEISRENGKILVRVTDPKLRDVQELEMTAWKSIGPMADAVVEGLRRVCLVVPESTTRNTYRGDLSSGFLPFCIERQAKLGRGLEWTDLDSDLIALFASWLERRQKSDGTLLSIQTKGNYFSRVKKLVSLLSDELEKRGVSCRISSKPFKEKYNNSLKTEPLSEKEFKELLVYIGEHVLETIRNVSPLLDEVIALRKSDDNFESVESAAQCCAYILAKHDGRFPERQHLEPSDIALVGKYGYTRLRTAVFPQLNDLIPLLLLIACLTGFNQQPLSGIELSDITEAEIFGKKRVLYSPSKKRARGKRQRRSFVRTEETLNPINVLEFVINWTSILREIAPAAIKEHVFLCANKWKGENEWIRSIGVPENGTFANATTAIDKFISRKFKRYIGTRLMRASFAEHVNQLLDGDIDAIATLLGHSSTAITHRSYQSSAAKERDALALAGAMNERERYVISKGRVDPRRTPLGEDRTAATPGWGCLDSTDSPIPGQIRGRPCTAFGHCPGCELSYPDRDPVIALARSIQLLERMDEATNEAGTVAFNAQFGRPFRFLTTTHIPSLATEENLAAARRLSLNPLPRLL